MTLKTQSLSWLFVWLTIIIICTATKTNSLVHANEKTPGKDTRRLEDELVYIAGEEDLDEDEDTFVDIDDGMELTKKQVRKWKKPQIKGGKRGEWKIDESTGELISDFQSKGTKKTCCRARVPSCCYYGTEMLWSLGKKGQFVNPGAVATQPAVYNPSCFNTIDFDTIPSPSGQPFCHEFDIGNTFHMNSASLEAIIYSNPPCPNSIQDQFCLTTASGTEWCTMLQPGENKFCLDLDELGLLDDGGMTTLLARTAYHSYVDYLSLHIIYCDEVSVLPPVTSSASMYFEFENNLFSSVPGVPSFVLSGGTDTYFNSGPDGTAVVFPETPDVQLEMPNHSSQQGGSAMSMAVWVYFDEPDPDTWPAGMTLVSKYGSYRWMLIPGYDWGFMHVHLGPFFGDLIFAQHNPDNPGFQVPLKKWLCLAVTIEADAGAGTTTLKYYLNGELWGPPTIANEVYDMDGVEPLKINNIAFGDGNNWPGKIDTFALWKSVLHPKDVHRFCKCDED